MQDTHSVLIRVETTVVEASIGVAHRHGKGGSSGIVLEVIDEVDVVSSEVDIAKRCIGGHGITYECESRAIDTSITLML